jgi:RNA polymerase sigma-70 factor (ECF subfamily)
MSPQPEQPYFRSAGERDSLPQAPAERSEDADIQVLFREHNRALMNFLAARLQSESEAQDVAQEAYVRLLRLEKPGTVSFLRAYLFRIAGNLAVDRLRQRAVRKKSLPEGYILFEQLLSKSGPERITLAEEQLEVVKDTLRELPDKCRKAFALHFFADDSVAEIANAMHLSQRMVRYYVARDLAHCRTRLDDSFYNPR